MASASTSVVNVSSPGTLSVEFGMRKLVDDRSGLVGGVLAFENGDDWRLGK